MRERPLDRCTCCRFRASRDAIPTGLSPVELMKSFRIASSALDPKLTPSSASMSSVDGAAKAASRGELEGRCAASAWRSRSAQ